MDTSIDEQPDLDYRDVFSDSDYSKAHQKILKRAKRTRFREKDSIDTFEADFKKVAEKHRETLLHRVAKIKDEKDFNDCNGPELVKWVVDKNPEILLKRGVGRDSRSVLHITIENQRLAFLDCILEFPKRDLERALEQENLAHDNCLHAAIDKRLLCTKRLVTKCNLDTLVKQSENADKYTPLHLLMEKQSTARNAASSVTRESTTANISAPRPKNALSPLARADSGPGGGTPTYGRRVAPTSRNFNESEKEGFDPAEILETMISQWDRDRAPNRKYKSRTNYLTELMTAVNSDGESPYQVRVRTSGTTPKTKNKELLQRLETIIMENLTEIPLIGKALYGSQGDRQMLIETH
jgi:hypothetical protein